MFYRDKGSRPITRPQVLQEKFEDFAYMMIEKLKTYEDQCRTHRDHSINGMKYSLENFYYEFIF